MERDWIEVERERSLGVGMALTAEIKTDRHQVIDYLLSPMIVGWTASTDVIVAALH